MISFHSSALSMRPLFWHFSLSIWIYWSWLWPAGSPVNFTSTFLTVTAQNHPCRACFGPPGTPLRHTVSGINQLNVLFGFRQQDNSLPHRCEHARAGSRSITKLKTNKKLYKYPKIKLFIHSGFDYMPSVLRLTQPCVHHSILYADIFSWRHSTTLNYYLP